MHPSLNNVAESAAAAGDVARAAAQGVAEVARRLVDVEQAVADQLTRAPAGVAPDRLANAIATHEAVAKFATALQNGDAPDPARFTVRTLSNDISRTTAPIVPAHVVPGINGLPMRRLRVADLLPKRKATTNSIIFLRQIGDTSAAAPVSELTTKPETQMTFEEVEAPVITLPHWVRVSKQILADVPGLQNFISQRLIYGLSETRERQIMSGSGVGENLEGLLTVAGEAAMQGVLGDATGTWRGQIIERPNHADIIRTALTDIEIAGGMPADAIIMHPTDIASIEASKRPDGRYVIVEDAETGTRQLVAMWQLPVVSSINVEPGSYLAGSFQQGAALYVRGETSVEVGYAGTDFTENALRILAEERFAMPIWQPGCFIKGEF